MNLAIEFFLRTNEFNHNLEFPYSIFVEKKHDYRAIVIYKSLDGNLEVRHWLLDRCDKDDTLPPFKTYKCKNLDDECIILSEFNLFEYREEFYESGRIQHTSSPYSEIDEEDYNDCVDNILNSKKHKDERKTWLWNNFSSIYDIKIYGYSAEILPRLPFYIQHRWWLWEKYLLEFSMNTGQIAGELLLQKEYDELYKRENRKSLNSGLISWWGTPAFAYI